ncbi:hypothetical protein BDZ45DRAFT_243429 [Acephala macrosclerotiorum]|nr:hypothetical protein BDZ45DRAFT_243429 [Acephala macrosclerotiorum]
MQPLMFSMHGRRLSSNGHPMGYNHTLHSYHTTSTVSISSPSVSCVVNHHPFPINHSFQIATSVRITCWVKSHGVGKTFLRLTPRIEHSQVPPKDHNSIMRHPVPTSNSRSPKVSYPIQSPPVPICWKASPHHLSPFFLFFRASSLSHESHVPAFSAFSHPFDDRTTQRTLMT